MKTAKKLFSLLLVAVLLMSAIPFQASAAEISEYVVDFYDKDGNWISGTTGTVSGDNVTFTAPAAGAVANHTFAGWSVNSQTEVRASLSSLKTGDFTLYATETRGEDTVKVYTAQARMKYTADHVHNFVDGTVKAPNCTEAGYTTQTCDNRDNLPAGVTSCSETKQVKPTSALGHDFGDWAVVTAAQVGVAGLEKRECKRDGCNHYETRAIPALAVPTYTVTFKYEDESVCDTRSWPQNHLITELPAGKDILNKRFDGWYTAKVGGERVQVGNTWYGTNQYTTLYARYIDSVKDNMSTVSVFVRFYSEGIQQGETIFMDSFTLTDNSKLLAALQAKQSAFANKIYTIKSSNDYLWNESFYMYASGEKITDSDMRINGDTSILLKVDAKKSAKANVLLYVHNKAGEAATRLYEMNGYTAGNTVTASAVQNFLKAQTGKTYTISGLYDQDRWEQLANGQNPTAAGGLDVPTSGTLKIHVILSNFSSGTSSKPASNPSTGDPIMATAGIMVLAAAALVSILELRKRKMI